VPWHIRGYARAGCQECFQCAVVLSTIAHSRQCSHPKAWLCPSFQLLWHVPLLGQRSTLISARVAMLTPKATSQCWRCSYSACQARLYDNLTFYVCFSSVSMCVQLFATVVTCAGLWSQVKRAPKAKIKRKTFETPGPEAEDGMTMDSRCRPHLHLAFEMAIIFPAICSCAHFRTARLACQCMC
jgi:hypothetical protein